MRVLFSTTAGAGHFGPLVPFATACRKAGHEVVVAAPASFAAAVAGAGLDHRPFADVPPDELGAVFGRLSRLPPGEADAIVVGEVFGRLDARAALPGLVEALDAWRPDVVVREPAEVASLVAAEYAGLPHVQVAAAMDELDAPFQEMLAAPLAELGQEAGLPADRPGAAMAAAPRFTCVPASLTSGAPDGAARWRFRDPSLAAAPARLPGDWGDPDLPLVYVTFGSVAATTPPFAPIYHVALDALAGMPVRVLMTTGAAGDPESLAPHPANARVERWWPQPEVMAAAAAVVGHGGFGTTMTALAAGVPQVVVPLFSFDQAVNADRVAAVGAGVQVPGAPHNGEAIAAALTEVLADGSYRTAAGHLAADIAALPDAAESVPVLEEIAGSPRRRS